MTPLRRHDLAYLHADARVEFATRSLPEAVERWVSQWLAEGRPLVVCRQRMRENGAESDVDLGICLPNHLGRQKLACRVRSDAVARFERPISVDQLNGVLQIEACSAMTRLAGAAQRLGVSVGVYGSTAWECLSGASYRRCGSDIDLICDVAHREVLPVWLRAMERSAQDVDGRLDGEVRFPDGKAVAWRELSNAFESGGAVRVMFKGIRDVGFASLDSLQASMR